MMGNFIIRRAEREDIPKIIALSAECMEYSQSPYRDTAIEELKRFRAKDLEQLYSLFGQPQVGLFVAVEEDIVVGHVIVLTGNFEMLSMEQQGWIIDLSVKREFWRKGIGRELSLKAEQFIKDKGLKYMGLGVTGANAAAVKFYESLGYNEERKRMIKRL